MQKILLDKFPWNFHIWSAIVNDVCMQKIKIGHRANFRAKYKCFPQMLFPVRAILRSINFRCTDFVTDSGDACILVIACVDCARVHLKTLSSLLKTEDLESRIYLLQINSTRIQTNNKITLKLSLMENVKEKRWRRQPKALMHHTRDASSN